MKLEKSEKQRRDQARANKVKLVESSRLQMVSIIKDEVYCFII